MAAGEAEPGVSGGEAAPAAVGAGAPGAGAATGKPKPEADLVSRLQSEVRCRKTSARKRAS